MWTKDSSAIMCFHSSLTQRKLARQKKAGHIFWKQIISSVKSGLLQIVMLLKYKNFGWTMPKKRIFLKMIQNRSQNCDHLYLRNEKFASSLELFPPYKIKSNWTKKNFWEFWIVWRFFRPILSIEMDYH